MGTVRCKNSYEYIHPEFKTEHTQQTTVVRLAARTCDMAVAHDSRYAITDQISGKMSLIAGLR